MRTASHIDAVMASFKAPTNYARFFFAGDAQGLVDGLTQGELRGFGLDDFLEVNEPDSEQLVVSFGPFDGQVKAPALFKRLELLFDTGRLPENRRAEASIDLPNVGSGPLHLSILTLFGALKAAGADLSSEINPVDTRIDSGILHDAADEAEKREELGIWYDKPTVICALGPWTSTFRGRLHADIYRDGVKLTCSTEFVCEQTGTEQREYSPIAINRLGDRMSFDASVPEHSLATEGHRVLEHGLRTILLPFVGDDSSFWMWPNGNSLVVGVRGAVMRRHIQEASQELGIGMDGAVVPPEQ